MKHLFIILGSILLSFTNLFSQRSIDNIVAEIEKNNTTLSALRKNADAELLANKTGIYLQNPEVVFNYLWGDPSYIGTRTDINITQTLDFPSAYIYRNQISDFRNLQVELEYEKQRKSILYQARVICTNIIYLNALKSEFGRRVNNSEGIVKSYKAKYEKGDASVLEYNRAQLTLINLMKDLESTEAERISLQAELAGLNGGNNLDLTDTLYLSQAIVPDFEQWYSESEQNNPVLKWLKQEVIISQKQVNLNTASSLPKLQGGYMSEKVIGQQYQGIVVGITVPLWEDKNTVKYAKAKAIAARSVEADTKARYYNELKRLHLKAINLQKSLDDYKKNLSIIDSSDLLKKSFITGEISLSDYYYELSVYYESADRLLELERDLNLTLVELNRFN